MPNNPYDVDGNYETFELGNGVTNQNPQGSSTGSSNYNPWGSPYTQNTGYADPYDSRIGNGALPIGIQGTQNRAYTRTPQENELVENRLTNLLSRDNPYIGNARLRAEEMANSRGLLNSSMAAGAAERSAIEAGLPIASQDASTFATAASENMGALNTRALADLDASLRRGDQSNALRIAGMNNAGALQRQRENLAFEGEQNALDRDWNLARDNYNYHYDLGRYDRQTQNNIAEYGAITRINYQQQTRNFWDGLMQLHAADPEAFDLETIGSMFSVYSGVSDDLSLDLDNWIGW